MRKAAFVLGCLALLSPAVLRAQGLAIDHARVGCVVAGKSPRLSACFSPASRLARARVYFRVADASPDWYYVEMTSDAPCHAGVLPRPKKELVGRRIQYYVDAFDRAFAESRTPEGEAVVVSSHAECESKLPVAPIVEGATVAVFPTLPAGFAGAAAAGGLGAGATALAALGGAAVVGGGVALAAGGSEGPSGGGSPTTTLPPAPTTTTTTTTTTTLPSGSFNPVFKVFRAGSLEVSDSISGPEPLVLDFDMCESSGPYPLRFGVEVDGVKTTDGCRSQVTFTTNGAVRSSASRSYDVRMTIRSQGPNNDPSANRRLTVVVDPGTGGGCSGDTQGPVVSLTKPRAGALFPSPDPYPVRFEASASDSTTGNNGIAFVEYKVYEGSSLLQVFGPLTGASPWPYDWTESAVNAFLGSTCAKFLDVLAYAQDGCGNATYSSRSLIIVNNTGSCTPDEGPAPGASAAAATVVSELAVKGGSGQVVANGEASFPRAGRSALALRLERGENRVEATLVQAASGGTWRFELGAVRGFRPESLRVVAGDVAEVAGGALTFRLQGRAGERVVFTFRAE